MEKKRETTTPISNSNIAMKNKDALLYLDGYIHRKVTLYNGIVYENMRIYSENFECYLKFKNEKFIKLIANFYKEEDKGVNKKFIYTYQNLINAAAYKSDLKKEQPHIMIVIDLDVQDREYLYIKVLTGKLNKAIKNSSDVKEIKYIKLDRILVDSYYDTLINDEESILAKEEYDFNSQCNSICDL